MVFIDDFTGCCGDRLGVVIQLHPRQQLIDLRLIKRMLGCRQIDLGHFAFGGRQHMVQLTVVRNQQKARRIFIKPANRLHTALTQGKRQ